MTPDALADIENFLSLDLSERLGAIRMALCWVEADAAAVRPSSRRAGAHRLEGELLQIEQRAAELRRSLRRAAPLPEPTFAQPEAGSETDCQLSGVDDTPEPALAPNAEPTIDNTPEPVLTAPEAPADYTGVVERLTSNGLGDADPDPIDGPQSTAGEDSTEPSDLHFDLPDGKTDDDASELDPEPGHRSPQPRAGLPPAGLMALDPLAAADLEPDAEVPVARWPADAMEATEDTDGELADPDDNVVNLPAAAAAPEDPGAAFDPTTGDAVADMDRSDIGASIDALLDAAEAARSRTDDGELRLDFGTLERILGDVRAAIPDEPRSARS